MLRVEGLHKSYGKLAALVGVDLDIAAGEICGLLGPNGAGKTTLVSIVAGLRRADAGRVTVGGVDVARRPYEARAQLGFAPQELGIYPIVSVRQNLSLFGELAGVRGAALAARIEEVADALELTDLLHRMARDLSGGEKRRLHTAMALIHRPPLLLLDEPTTGVDVRTRTRLLAAVRDLAARDGTAICYSTHYLPEVEALGASVAIIERGRVIARGTVAELITGHGGTAIELRFAGNPPLVGLPGRRVEVSEGAVRIYTDQPASDAAAILAGLGTAASTLRSVDIVAPSLESVFLSLTGRRYRSDGDGAAEPSDNMEEGSGVLAS